jgi:hypothetical protein
MIEGPAPRVEARTVEVTVATVLGPNRWRASARTAGMFPAGTILAGTGLGRVRRSAAIVTVAAITAIEAVTAILGAIAILKTVAILGAAAVLRTIPVTPLPTWPTLRLSLGLGGRLSARLGLRLGGGSSGGRAAGVFPARAGTALGRRLSRWGLGCGLRTRGFRGARRGRRGCGRAAPAAITAAVATAIAVITVIMILGQGGGSTQ